MTATRWLSRLSGKYSPIGARGCALAMSAVLVLLAVCSAGCMGYRNHYDLDADKYDAARLATGLGAEAQEPTPRKARCVVNVATYLSGELAEPISTEQPELNKMAARTIRDMRMFTDANIGPDILRPDYTFTFDIRIEISREPGIFSGLILPFYKVRQTTVRLQVLDDKGEPFANYITSAETFEVRHIFLLPLTPFYWPGSAYGNAQENLFEALAVKLIKDRKEFL